MTGQEFKKIGQKLYKERQYEAAVKLLASAAESFPKDEQLSESLGGAPAKNCCFG